MVAFWGRNAEAIHIEHMVDVGFREPVVLLVMGCTCKKQDFLRLVVFLIGFLGALALGIRACGLSVNVHHLVHPCLL
jgi:hypothetical protein